MRVVRWFSEIARVLRESRLASSVLGGLSAVGGIKIVGLGLGFLSHVVLARVTSVENYGIYIYVWGWVTVLAYVSRAGFDNLLERYLSKFQTEEQWQELRGVFRRALQYVGTFAVFIGAVGAGTVWLLSAHISAPMMRTFWWGFALLPVLSTLYIIQSGLRGLKFVGRAFIPELLVRHTVLITACTVLWLVFGSFESWELMGVTIGAFIFAVCVAAFMLQRALPQQAIGVNINYGPDNWLKKALPFMIFAGASIVQRKTDILMLGIFATPRDVGIYGVAIRLVGVIGLALSVMNRTVRPYFSEMYTEDEMDSLQWLTTLTVIIVTPISLLSALTLVLFGPAFLSLFGAEYVSGYSVLVVLVGGRLVAALAGPVGVFMIMTDQESAASKIEGAAAVANIILNAALIPYFGVEGAALATAMTLSARNLAFAYFVKSKHGINATIFNPNIIRIIQKVPA